MQWTLLNKIIFKGRKFKRRHAVFHNYIGFSTVQWMFTISFCQTFCLNTKVCYRFLEDILACRYENYYFLLAFSEIVNIFLCYLYKHRTYSDWDSWKMQSQFQSLFAVKYILLQFAGQDKCKKSTLYIHFKKRQYTFKEHSDEHDKRLYSKSGKSAFYSTFPSTFLSKSFHVDGYKMFGTRAMHS